ncbi:MAG: SMP-30/gluconolactonase/LRE family protein, partial [Phaeodactylibacter sp.]|nr:SMP-30/gluconolactonase/LRE family protein [Phaeodactylibacter sp.]
MKPTFLTLLCGLLALPLSAQTNLYWINPGVGIETSDLDGNDRTVLIPIESTSAQGIAVDIVHKKIYWTEWDEDRIRRADLDGENIEVVVEDAGLDFPEGITVDPSGEKIYWVDSGTGKIQRADFDDSNVEDLIDLPDTNLDGIVINPANNRLYWAQYAQENGTSGPSYGKIRSAKLNGTDTTTLVAVYLGLMKGLAIDPEAGKVYWTDCGHGKIQRANLDGSNIEDLVVTGLGSPNSMDLDLENGFIYWSDGGSKDINRSSLDGDNPEVVVNDMNAPQGVLVVNCPEKSVDCFATAVEEIQKAELHWQLGPNPVSDDLELRFDRPAGKI